MPNQGARFDLGQMEVIQGLGSGLGSDYLINHSTSIQT